MSIRKVGGHGVTSVLSGSDHTVVHAAPPKLTQTMGPANYQGTNSKAGGGLPGGRGGKGVAQTPKEQTGTTKVVPLRSK